MELHLIGGFLGSGKTTAIVHAARLLTQRGEHVGIITNEQGKHLVDSGFIHSQGLHALEVTGGCICCNLDDFEERIEEITQQFNPQVLFAESVGSCADLVATVIKPLADYRKSSAEPASLSVFTDSRLLLRYLRGQEMPFSEAVIYIFEKQIEETDLLIINKIDLLSEVETEEIVLLVENRYPRKTIKLQDSHQQNDIEGWLLLIESAGMKAPGESIDLNYDIYAKGEGSICWLDRVIELSFTHQNSGTHIVQLVEKVFEGLTQSGGTIAHLKFLADSSQISLKINLTCMDSTFPTGAMEEMKKFTGSPVNLTINAMIVGDLTIHASLLDNIITSFCKENNINIKEAAWFDRVPGYPRPTMRIGN
jgi:Ni2+-binding GTPase involved in maturation of urease and hydrogenase